MRTKLRNMLGLWGEAGLLVYLTLSNGEEVEGLVKEVDGDELVMELMNEEGEIGTLCVVMLHHVVTATYIEPDATSPTAAAAIERERELYASDEEVEATITPPPANATPVETGDPLAGAEDDDMALEADGG
jgi:hypothetical protein